MPNTLRHTTNPNASYGVNTSKHMRGRLTSRRDITSTLWAITIRPEKQIPFTPGQYVTIGLTGASKIVERPYSIVSSPRDPDLEFFVELVPDGQLTPQLYDVPVGGEVYLRPAAKGRFVYDGKSGHPHHLMISTVTGVAPFVSMVRDIALRTIQGEVFSDSILLLQAASMAEELGYERELEAIANKHGWFHYIPMISRIWLDGDWRGERGRAEDVVRKYQDLFAFRPADTTAYVCGNPNLINNVSGMLKRAGFATDSIRREMFWMADKSESAKAVRVPPPKLRLSPLDSATVSSVV